MRWHLNGHVDMHAALVWKSCMLSAYTVPIVFVLPDLLRVPSITAMSSQICA